jgi:hypothetical protein
MEGDGNAWYFQVATLQAVGRTARAMKTSNIPNQAASTWVNMMKPENSRSRYDRITAHILKTKMSNVEFVDILVSQQPK